MKALWILAALLFAIAAAGSWRADQGAERRLRLALALLFGVAALGAGLAAFAPVGESGLLLLACAALGLACGVASLVALFLFRSVLEHASLAGEKARALEAELKRYAEESSAHLEASRARFRALAEVAPIGILETDAAGRCTYASERWSELTGCTRESALGEGWLEAVDARERARVQRAWSAAVSRGQAFQDELLISGRTPPRRLLCHLVPRAVEGANEAGYVGTLTDVTERRAAEDERRKLEARIQHAQKLESLGVLAGGIAHDFNNLLVGILGNVHVLKERLAGQAEVELHLARVETAALRASDLARDMLRYAGRGSAQLELVDLSAIVAEMVPLLDVSRPAGTSVHCALDPDLPALEADPTQLRQVVLNLMTNALEACAEHGGRIDVLTGSVRSEAISAAETNTGAPFSAGEALYLEVADSGAGIHADTVARMFDPFFTTKPRGRGLGLAVVLGVVRKLHGAIQVHSTPGEGTTIRVLFAASDRAPVALESKGRAARE